MTPTDELRRRVAVLINLHQRGTDLGPIVDTIIRLVVERCARIGPDAVATLGLPEEPQYEGDVRHIERRAVLGYSDRILELAPKEPAP